MYEPGKGAGLITGVTNTAAGAALLPNTSGNVLLMALAIATIGVGVVALSSFVVARASHLLAR
jgi:hypothetical protein